MRSASSLLLTTGDINVSLDLILIQVWVRLAAQTLKALFSKEGLLISVSVLRLALTEKNIHTRLRFINFSFFAVFEEMKQD